MKSARRLARARWVRSISRWTRAELERNVAIKVLPAEAASDLPRKEISLPDAGFHPKFLR
jgi:hypothetical protein